MLEFIKNQKYYAYFLVISFLFLVMANSMVILDYLYTYGVIFGMISCSLFIAYAFLYLNGVKNKGHQSKILDLIFILSLLNFIAAFTLTGPVAITLLQFNAYALYAVAISLIFMIAISFPLFLGAYLVRDRKAALIGIFIFIAVLVIVLIFFFSGIIIKYYVINDEFFISINDLRYLFKGINPYTYSLSQQIYHNETSVGWTLTTNNQIIGDLNYPALYLLSYLPFYFAASPTIYNMEHYMAPIQGAVFLTILLFTIAFCIDKKYLKSPVYGILLFIAFFFVNITSITMYLMLALLVLAYAKTGTKYSWLFFGLCISIQELLWVPVLLLLVYTLNNYGIKKGVYDLLGAVLVFLIINSYFIALGPMAFINGIFNPLEKLILPIGSAPLFGFFILTNYHILLTSYTAIFGIIILLMLILYAYFNNKLLLGLFGMLPLFFLPRPLIAYYAFFVTFLFVTLLVKRDAEKKGLLEAFLRKRKMLVTTVAMLLLLLLIAIIYGSHVAYAKGFDLHVSNQSLHYDNSSNETIYTGTLNYSNASVNDVYIMFVGYGAQKSQIIGIFNYSAINNSVKCSGDDIECLLNVNRINLSNDTGTYQIKAYLGRTSTSARLMDGRLFIYNGKYFYMADAVSSNN